MITMHYRNHEIVAEQFFEAIHELFDCYTGVAPQINDQINDRTGTDLTAIIGLGSSKFRATASISTTYESVLSLADFPVESAQDWLGELANQLGGRLKNKLSTFGLDASLCIPTSVQGKHLSLSSVAESYHRLSVKYMGGQMRIALSVDCDKDLELYHQVMDRSAKEGSLELF